MFPFDEVIVDPSPTTVVSSLDSRRPSNDFRLPLTHSEICDGFWSNDLTHWGRDKMAAIFQTTYSNAFVRMTMYKFLLIFHWSWAQGSNWQYPRIGSNNGLAPARRRAIIWINVGMFYWRMSASLGLSVLSDSIVTIKRLLSRSRQPFYFYRAHYDVIVMAFGVMMGVDRTVSFVKVLIIEFVCGSLHSGY